MLDRTFAALADPTRRAIVVRLNSRGALSVGEIARPLPMSLPAVIKHLDVLENAGLVGRMRSGRTVICRLKREPMRKANDWLGRHARFWVPRLDRLVELAEA